MLAQDGHDGEQRAEPVAEQTPVGRFLLLRRQRLEDTLLRLRAEAGQRSQLFLLGRLLQLLDRRDVELTPDPSRRLRAEPRQPHEAHDFRRDDPLPLRKRVHLTVLDDLDDLLFDRLADPLQLLGPPGHGELRHGAGGLTDARRCAAVGKYPERSLPFQLQQVGQQLQLLGHVHVPRHNAAQPTAPSHTSRSRHSCPALSFG